MNDNNKRSGVDDYVSKQLESYYGKDGEPVLCAGGYHRIERTWYDKDHAKSEAWFDTEGKPITRGNTFVKIEREYDEAWNVNREVYYGQDGETLEEIFLRLEREARS